MVGHGRTPGVQNGGDADAGAEVLGMSAAIVSTVSEEALNNRS